MQAAILGPKTARARSGATSRHGVSRSHLLWEGAAVVLGMASGSRTPFRQRPPRSAPSRRRGHRRYVGYPSLHPVWFAEYRSSIILGALLQPDQHLAHQRAVGQLHQDQVRDDRGAGPPVVTAQPRDEPRALIAGRPKLPRPRAGGFLQHHPPVRLERAHAERGLRAHGVRHSPASTARLAWRGWTQRCRSPYPDLRKPHPDLVDVW